jgi:hypothetical protein
VVAPAVLALAVPEVVVLALAVTGVAAIVSVLSRGAVAGVAATVTVAVVTRPVGVVTRVVRREIGVAVTSVGGFAVLDTAVDGAKRVDGAGRVDRRVRGAVVEVAELAAMQRHAPTNRFGTMGRV